MNNIDYAYKRHYIFINPNDLNCDIHLNPRLNYIKNIHSKYYKNNEEVIYWSYNMIKDLALKYDKELYDLFIEINPNYPALLADIGRYLILYYHGGVYHDLKCISNVNLIKYLTEEVNTNVKIIGETHPQWEFRTRSGNIISLCTMNIFFNEVLIKIKNKLIQEKKNNTKGPRLVVEIGSGTYIEYHTECEGDEIIKEKLLKRGFLTFDNNIYIINIVKWQDTHEFLFKQK